MPPISCLLYTSRLAEANDGTVETVHLSPRERCAGLEAQFLVLDLKPGDLPGFFRVLQYSTGLCLEAKTTGEVCMSMTIPDVFIKRSEASPVSYTHLDVYKRQPQTCARAARSPAQTPI